MASFNTARIDYEQWSKINRTLCGCSLELQNCRFKETAAESKKRRLKDIRECFDILSTIHNSSTDV